MNIRDASTWYASGIFPWFVLPGIVITFVLDLGSQVAYYSNLKGSMLALFSLGIYFITRTSIDNSKITEEHDKVFAEYTVKALVD
jgi:hypothetical protein